MPGHLFFITSHLYMPTEMHQSAAFRSLVKTFCFRCVWYFSV